MNKDIDVLAEGPFAVGDVRITWVAERMAISAAGQGYLRERWGRYEQDARAAGKSLFDGSITRLVAARRDGAGLALVMGPAQYSEFVVTTLRDREWFLKHDPAAMVTATGNSVLITHGNEALLGIRSKRVSAYAGRAHLFGGVLDQLAESGRDAAGLVAHLEKELHEELLISRAEMVGGPRLLAVVRDNFLMQPEVVWQWESAAAISDVARRVDPHEHEGFVILRREKPDAAVWVQMTPVARAAWERWQRKNNT